MTPVVVLSFPKFRPSNCSCGEPPELWDMYFLPSRFFKLYDLTGKATDQMLLAAISNASHQLEWSHRWLWRSQNLTRTQIHTNRPGLSWTGKTHWTKVLEVHVLLKVHASFLAIATSVLGPILGQDQRSNAVGPCSHLPTSWGKRRSMLN